MVGSHGSFLKGQFLIAMPGLADPNFFQTVTCISEHTEDGAVGIVVNRTHSLLTGEDIFKELKIAYHRNTASIPIHIGGPVHAGEIFILHGPPFQWQGCLKITSTLAMSNTMDILKAIAEGRGPAFYIICLGCAGWGPGQLEMEIKDNVWLTGPIVEEIVFQSPVPTRWEAALKEIGVDPDVLSTRAGHA